MRSLLILALTVAVAFSAVISRDAAIEDIAGDRLHKGDGVKRPAAPNGFAYAIDTVAAVTLTNFNCIYSYGYRLAFLRLYSPVNDGKGDATGIANIQNAVKAGLGFEVIVTPSTSGVKLGSQQFSEAYAYATSNKLSLNRIWLQVTSPINWGGNAYLNVQFIKDFIANAKANGISVGIYTNWYDWQQITGGSSTVYPDSLWYWSANGVGYVGESPANTNDFVKFGPFNSPFIKQFGIGETICSTTVNIEVYTVKFEGKPNTIAL